MKKVKEVYVRLEHYNAEETTLHIRKHRLSFENEEYEDDCNDEYNVCIKDDTDQKWDVTLKKKMHLKNAYKYQKENIMWKHSSRDMIAGF